jgi:hypothetical protein
MIILKRPPGDTFTIRVFFNLISKIKRPADCIYLWSPIIDPKYQGYWDYTPYWEGGHWYPKKWYPETEFEFKQQILDYIKNDLIVLGVKDHLTSYNFNPWTETMPVMVEYLQDFANFYADKKIIIITSMENLSAYVQAPNLTIVPWGGDITNQMTEYKRLIPVVEKNFNSDRIFLNLNRNKRSHRAVTVSLLYGLGIQDKGLISCMFKDIIKDIFDFTKWQFNDKQQDIKLLIGKGFDILKDAELSLNDEEDIYGDAPNDNVTNFSDMLSNYYRETFVEIISETSFTEKSYLLTEKTLNSIYGCNFPILLCGQGSVKFLRDMGLDVFDDIVNHSYDSIENPVDRIYKAITDNIELLTNSEKTKELWKNNQHRFLANINFVKNDLYKYYAERADKEFTQAIT